MRVTSCSTCGTRLVGKDYGPLPTRCDDCLKAHVRNQERIRRERLTEGRSLRQVRCMGCGAEMEWSGKGRPRLRCTPCLAAWTRAEGNRRSLEWIQADPERARERDRKGYERRAEKVRLAKLDEHLRRKYGLERADVDRMFAEQGGRCLICKSDQWGKKGPCVDHCHTKGHVRGLLCSNCNTMIGLAKEDPAILAAAIEYLKRE